MGVENDSLEKIRENFSGRTAVCKDVLYPYPEVVVVEIFGREIGLTGGLTAWISISDIFESRLGTRLTGNHREAIRYTMPKYVNVEEKIDEDGRSSYKIILDDLDKWFERVDSYLVYGFTSYNKLISSEFREKDSLEKIRENLSGKIAVCKDVLYPYPEVVVLEIFGREIGLTGGLTAWIRISDIFESRWGTGLTGNHREAIRYTMPKYVNVEEKIDEDRRSSYKIILDDLDEWFAKAKGFLAYAIPKQKEIRRKNKKDQVRKQKKEKLDEDNYRRRRGSGFAKAASMNTGL